MLGLCRFATLTAAAVVVLAGSAIADQQPAQSALRGDWEIGAPAPQGWSIIDRGPGCTEPVGNCQQFDGAGANLGSLSSDAVEGYGTAACLGGGFVSADDVTFAAAGNINSLCFWGRFQTAASAPTVATEVYDIVIYNDAGGFPGTVKAGPFRLSQTAGNLTRGPAIPAAFGPGFVWTGTLPAVPVAANECVWIAITGDAGATGHNGGANGRFRWMVSNNAALAPNRDNKLAQACHIGAVPPFTITSGDVITGLDAAFCVNLATAPGQCNPPFAANSTCAGATPLTIGGAPVAGDTAFGQLIATPFCGNNPVNGNTLWYSVTSATTQSVTLSTCSGTTDFDSVINVYCNTCGDLFCIANNDTSPNVGAGCASGANGDPSEATFVAEAGRTYLVAVFGFQLDAGPFEITASAGAAGGTPLPCASDRCSLTIPGGTVAEVDACGASTNSECNGAGVATFNIGDTISGTSYNVGTLRDFDFFELATPLAVDTWLDIDTQLEFPGIFNFFGGTCNQPTDNGTFLGGAFLNYCQPNVVQVLATAGQFRINMLPVDFGGVPCGAGNDYTIHVTPSVLGACCVPATACFITVVSDCDAQVGVYLGDNSVCCATYDSCAPTGGCRADFNRNCTTSVQDIFDFLAGYFNNDPAADINGVGGLTVQDIFDFLGFYFSGPCP